MSPYQRRSAYGLRRLLLGRKRACWESTPNYLAAGEQPVPVALSHTLSKIIKERANGFHHLGSRCWIWAPKWRGLLRAKPWKSPAYPGNRSSTPPKANEHQ